MGEIARRLRPLVEPLWDVAIGAVEKRAETPTMQGRPWAERQGIASGPLRRSLFVPDAVGWPAPACWSWTTC